jgi:hypothetical protein
LVSSLFEPFGFDKIFVMNERRARVIEPIFVGFKSFKEAETDERTWWHSLTPLER